MKLTIQGSAKEIAALVLAVQERREDEPILLDGLILKKAAEQATRGNHASSQLLSHRTRPEQQMQTADNHQE